MIKVINILLSVSLCMAVCGCAQPAGVVFPPPATPILWPANPDPARIRYVGQLATSDDLKPARSTLDVVGSAIFGKPDVHALLTPFALCTDGGDRVFVADSNARLVHVFNLKTRRYAAWTPGEKEPAFAQPVGMAWDPAGRLLVCDSVAGAIFVFDTDGRYQKQLGIGLLKRPCGIAIHPTTGQLYVADSGAHQVVILSPTGQEITRVGRRGTGPGEFNFPINLAIDHQGRLYVADALNFRVQQFGPDLKLIRVIGSKGDVPGCFSQPKCLDVDSEDHLYVVDNQFEAVQIFDPEGRLLLNFGKEGHGPGQFWLPSGLFIDAHNRIWIADSYNRRVQVFDYLPEKQP